MRLQLRNTIRKYRAARALGAVLTGVLLTVGFVPTSAVAENRFIFANTSEFDTLDPHQTFDVGRVPVRLNLYDGLYRWEDNPPKIQPWLAESYTVSDDGLTWTFTLKKGSKFHDGSEVKARDVVYSMERILTLKKGAAALFSRMIESGNTQALDDYTVQFKLSNPSAIFLSIVPEIHVLNSELVKKHEKDGDLGALWLSSNDAGSGSFVLENYDPAVGFSATRFADHFYGWGDKYLDAIEFRTVSEVNTRVLGLLRGDIHGTGGYLPQDQVKRLRDTDKTYVMDEESMRIFLFQINNQRAPLNDVHVRRAISYAFDYDGFINDILSGSAERNRVPIPNTMWGVPKDVKGYDYDLAKAKEELAMASAKIDRPIDIAYLTGFSQTEQAAVLMQNGLRQIGVDTRVINHPWPVMVNKMAKHETSPDMVVYWISTYYADPNNWIGEMFNSKLWGTFKSSSFYKNPKVDALLDTALQSTDRPVREAAYEDAARIVTDEAAGIWIYNTKWFGPFNKKVKGVRFCPIGNGTEMRWIYFE